MPGRPNFLIIMTDQHRGDHLGSTWPLRHGSASPIRTPHIDRLAGEGVIFNRACVNNPLCMPSRATLLTGLSARAHGIRTNGIDLDPRIPTIAEALSSNGYLTFSSGKIHLRAYDIPRGIPPENLDPASFPESQWMWQHGKVSALPMPYYGFQKAAFTGGHTSWFWGECANQLKKERPGTLELLQPEAGTSPANGAEQTWKMAIPPEYHYNNWIAGRAIGFLEEAAKSGQPFLGFASFPDPHHAFAVPDPWYSMYDRASIPLPARRDGELDDLPPFFRKVWEKGVTLAGRDGPTKYRDDQIREIIAVTFGMVSFVDQQAGRVLDALDRLGLAGNTVVVFTSDHGDMLGDHWLINKGPFHFDGLLRVPSIWRVPGSPGGRVSNALVSHLDFAPTILDMAGIPAPEYGPPPGTAIRSPGQLRALPGHSLVPLLEGKADSIQDAVVAENDEDYMGLRLRTIITQKYQLTMYVGEGGEMPWGELFDTSNDPDQLHNRWNDPAMGNIKSQLKERLLTELVRTDNRLPRRHEHA